MIVKEEAFTFLSFPCEWFLSVILWVCLGYCETLCSQLSPTAGWESWVWNQEKQGCCFSHGATVTQSDNGGMGPSLPLSIYSRESVINREPIELGNESRVSQMADERFFWRWHSVWLTVDRTQVCDSWVCLYCISVSTIRMSLCSTTFTYYTITIIHTLTGSTVLF